MKKEQPSSSHSELDDSVKSQQSQSTQESTQEPAQESKQEPQQESNKEDSVQNTSQDSQTSKEGTGIWSTVQTVLGAMFGVQSEQQRQKDFEKGSPVQFIVGGIIFVVVFILTILYIVNSAVDSAGGG